MAIQLLGSSGDPIDSDSNKNLLVANGLPAHPAAGGWYSVAGSTSAVVAAALATDVTLMSMRFSAGSTRKAYITRARILIGVATVGASAGIPGTLGLQRFTNATPTGGTPRTVNEKNQPLATASDMTDVRDNNAALTVTSVTFGTEVARTLVPLFITSGAMWMEWLVSDDTDDYPVAVLDAGDGLCLRTRVAMAATQTWLYAYTFHWFEK